MEKEMQCCEAREKPNYFSHIMGEIIGTFLMCFLGIGAVATATLFEAHTGSFQVGMIWGLAIMIGIYAARNLSAAHFNPAVTFAMCLSGRCEWKYIPVYLLGQMTGAILAAASLWVLFADSVSLMLKDLGVDMSVNSPASSIWIEVFPNTANGSFGVGTAFFAEALGVFILVFIIFMMTEGCNLGRPSNELFPVFIGLTVAAIIGTVGPITNAGLNPVRDLGPRIVGALAGWSSIAFSWEIILVYTIGPLVGAGLAALLFVKVIEPLHHQQNSCC